MIQISVLLLMMNLVAQINAAAQQSDDGLLPLERKQLQQARKIDARIKIYDNASARLRSVFDAAVAREDIEAMPPALGAWMNLLNSSLKDIDAAERRKKKAKALINYEIHLRKSIAEVKDYKIRAPIEQQDFLDAWLAQAEKIRSRFFDVLFLEK
jgi:hypothetical protein